MQNVPGSSLSTYDEALARIVAVIKPLTAIETVPLTDCRQRILAMNVAADRDYPPFNRAAMDGYALRSGEVGRFKSFEVIGAIAAGQSADDIEIRPGQTVRIATGAPVPHDADAVIPHEQSDRGEPVHFNVDRVDRGASIHPRGVDAQSGRVVIPVGTVLGVQHLAVLATVGCTTVSVYRRPRVAILSSGDEVVDPSTTQVKPHQIRNSNLIMIRSAIGLMGGECTFTAHVKDDATMTRSAVNEALAVCDVLVTIGGVSAGERDFFPGAIDGAGFIALVTGAAIKPGQPIRVARRSTSTDLTQWAVSLPGNPVSALATAHLFLWPMLRILHHCSGPPAWMQMKLTGSVRAHAWREVFRPARCRWEAGEVVVPEWAGSGDLIHTGETNGLLRLPRQDEPISTGAVLPFLPWCWIISDERADFQSAT